MMTAFILLNSFNAAFAQDPCEGQKVVPNSWLVSVNEGDLATRDGLLETIDLLATGGFSTGAIFSYSKNITPAKTIVVNFEPAYWSDASVAAKKKSETLDKLSKIPGNKILCNSVIELSL